MARNTGCSHQVRRIIARILDGYRKRYFCFDICAVNVDWKLVRLIWIAFRKNDRNKLCFFSKLGKDVVNCIIAFLVKN